MRRIHVGLTSLLILVSLYRTVHRMPVRLHVLEEETSSSSSSSKHHFPIVHRDDNSNIWTSMNSPRMCQSTKRCDPISIQERISYLHISKNAGSSWIQELKRIKNISLDYVGDAATSFEQVGLYPTKHADQEHSGPFQDALLQKTGSSYRKFATVRSPRHHIWSLFSQCYNSQWGIYSTLSTNFPRNHPTDVIKDFSLWLDHFTTTTTTIRKQRDYFHCYHPANYQSRAFATMSENPHHVVDDIYEPDKMTVMKNYWEMDWISLSSFFHESKCLLYYRIYQGNTYNNDNPGSFVREYLDETCHCRTSNPHNITSMVIKDVKDVHYTEAHKRPTLADMDPRYYRKLTY